MRNLQPADERECRDVLIAVENFGKLALEEVDVWFKAIALPHLNGEEMIVILFGLLTRGVLSEKHFGYFLDVAERVGWQRIESIRRYTFQIGGKSDAQE